jgi:hypothetical protein
LTYTALTQELKDNKVHFALRDARNNAKLVGARIKKSKEEKKSADAPADA